jgi:5-methyltetrahydrofolate--homocysteine methyltransferase
VPESDLRAALRERVLLSDGSTGVALENLLREQTGETHFPEGCPDGLTLSRPHVVNRLHDNYLDAGADIILTNTFGANPLSLAAYDLAEVSGKLNREAAVLAKAAMRRHRKGWVLGSLGPGSLLPSLGQSTFDELRAAYLVQVRSLLAGGVDGFVVETCQDPLQAKAALSAVREGCPSPGEGSFVVVSLTLTEAGTMLLGTTVEAAMASVLPFRPDAIGLNCGLGPKELGAALAVMSSLAQIPLWLKPNAGLPVREDDRVVFPLQPEEFALSIEALVARYPVGIAGGCCGTTPAHILALASRIGRRRPMQPAGTWLPSLSSLYHRVTYRQEDSVLIVGERSNVNGSRRFRKLVESGDVDAAAAVTLAQADEGAHAVDLCVDLAGEDPTQRLTDLAGALRARCTMPLVLDSATPGALVAAARVMPGCSILNSVSFANGDGDVRQVARACLETGCAMVVLAIDEDGQAYTSAHKVRIALRADQVRRAMSLPEDAIFFDPLVLPIGSGQPDLERAAAETLGALDELRSVLPWMPTIAGISNVSHGLDAKVRGVLNSVMLQLAAERGLAAAIVHAGQIQPLHLLPHETRAAAEELLLNGAPRTRLLAFLERFTSAEEPGGDPPATPKDPLGALEAAVIRGDRSSLVTIIEEGLLAYPARTLLEEGLLRGMARVGELFKAGELQLPFVLGSAEVIREGTRLLGPHLPTSACSDRGTVVLATVEGDVHDIGKNLVGIILANNGFNVVDLGTRVPMAAAFRETVERGALALGLSGLLVQSVDVMVRGMEQIASLGQPFPPILVGGAALSEAYAARELAPRYPGLVFFGRDALQGLEIVQRLAQGDIPALPECRAPAHIPPRRTPRSRVTPPRPPFLGTRTRSLIPVGELWPFLNQHGLIRRFWRLRDEDLGLQYLAKMVPEIEKWCLTGAAVWGYWDARPHGTDGIEVSASPSGMELVIPVGREKGEGRSLQDYIAPVGDALALFMVTMGGRGLAAAEEARRDGLYSRYFLLHGLTMALTEALAEMVRSDIVREWGLGTGGKIYAPGMPAFPSLASHEQLFALLGPERIGISHTESWQLVPECSASGLILHHPEAEYFAIGGDAR